MRLLAFVRVNRGHIVQSDGGLGGQCVDLANVYLAQVWGRGAIQANAADWAGLHIAGMTWESNGPANAPPFGSLVVWRLYGPLGIGIDGHIAIALQADSMDLISLDQNWPAGSRVAIVLHDYGGVVGWHRPAG